VAYLFSTFITLNSNLTHFADVVRHFDDGRPQVYSGGRSAQPQPIQGGRHPVQHEGVLGGVALSRWQPHEPSKQMHPLVRASGGKKALLAQAIT